MRITEALNIREEESLPVLLFVLQSFFLGTFLGTFDVASNTLFLSSFESQMISKSYTISGLIGILLTSIYSSLQNRISFHKLALGSFATVFIATFLLRFGYYFSDTKWLAFGLFILMGPLNIIALLGFWGSAGRIFDLRQGKRLFGLIDLGQIIGIIISSWAVPVLVASSFSTINLMYISAISAFVAFLLQVLINSKFSSTLAVKPQSQAKLDKKQAKNGLVAMLRIPYVRIMALFVVCSTFAAFFVQYLFLAVSGSRFTDSTELAKFLGALMGTLTFISVLIKSFVYGPLMKNYGLKISLLLSPIVVGFITIGAALVGSLFGYTIESAAFTFFFLLIALSKIFQTSLKSSIESPSLKMLYQSLPPNIRYEVQARVDGTINEVSCVTSGLLLTAIGLLSFTSTMLYIYVLLAIVVVWSVITAKLYKGYRRTLEQTLEDSVKKSDNNEDKNSLFDSICTIPMEQQVFIVEKSRPWELPSFIAKNIEKADTQSIAILLAKTEEYGITSLIEPLQKLQQKTDTQNRTSIEQTVTYLKQILETAKSEATIKQLLDSKDYQERIEAAKAIGTSTKKSSKINLTLLLRDLVPAVKRQAIWASQGSTSKEVISFLIDFLNKNQYAAIAHGAIINSGDTGLELLALALQRGDSSTKFKERIIRIIPCTGSKNASKILLNNLKLKSDLCQATIDGLLQLNYKANEKEAASIKSLIVEQAGICSWNLNIQHQCPPDSEYPLLKFKLEDEYEASIRLLFDLLKLLYEKHSIMAVQENIESGTSQSITFAIEMLDTFLDDDLKTYLIPLLEDSSLSSKIWTLCSYFPLRQYSTTELLTATINRDNNLISKQTKILALNSFKFSNNAEITQDLVAQLFNSDKYLRQISAQIIESINQTDYLTYKKRLTDRSRIELDKLQDTYNQTGLTVADKLVFIKSMKMINPSKQNTDFMLYNLSTIKISKGIDLKQLELFKGSPMLIFVEKGGIEANFERRIAKAFSPGSTINMGHYQKTGCQLNTTTDTILQYVAIDKMAEELYDNKSLIADFGHYLATE